MTSQKKKQPLPAKHIPQRTCVGCRQVRPKRELIRIVRTAEGAVEVDPTGKRSGRGTYLCKAKACWEAGLKRERMNHTLRVKIDPEDRSRLAHYGETLP